MIKNQRGKLIWIGAAVLLIAVNLCILTGCKEDKQQYHHQVSVMYINVGKADSILVQVDEKNFLIDAGENDSVPSLFRALQYKEVAKLDGVILTHTHSDHIGGMEALAQRCEIENVYSAEISMNEETGENKIQQVVEQLALPHKKLKAGDQIAITSDVYFEVLGPLQYNDADDNDNSLVLKLSVNGKTFLFTGDMQFAEEETLLKAGADVSADILKVANHGNKDATSVKFAKAVSPEIAVISTDTSVDENSANKKVKAFFSSAKVYVTEDYACGVLIKIDTNGNTEVSDPIIPKLVASLEIQSVSLENQTVTIINNGDEVDLSGYFIFSTKGKEVFCFPEGSRLLRNEKITIACTGKKGDYIWKEEKVWSTKKEDIALLYDSYGNKLSSCVAQ
ncbi:ComEC/Rec2 family competence protein [Anaeromicropila populeti]|nr:MBL fold metallo-hydrolase [Anaeromicropila populeti]